MLFFSYFCSRETYYFSDIAKLEKQCKFSDCQHDTERIAHVTARFFLLFISFDTLKSAGRKFFKGKELEK